MSAPTYHRAIGRDRGITSPARARLRSRGRPRDFLLPRIGGGINARSSRRGATAPCRSIRRLVAGEDETFSSSSSRRVGQDLEPRPRSHNEPWYRPPLRHERVDLVEEMIDGAACRALRNISRTPFFRFADPLERSSALHRDKLHSLSFATAFAAVSARPGGPKSRCPSVACAQPVEDVGNLTATPRLRKLLLHYRAPHIYPSPTSGTDEHLAHPMAGLFKAASKSACVT